jgi:hypothetical protein
MTVEERRPSGSWDSFQEWSANKDSLVSPLLQLGFAVDHMGDGYSVTDDRQHQVAIFTLDLDGRFKWGWVEHEAGNGRTDFTSRTQWAAALTGTHKSRKGIS